MVKDYILDQELHNIARRVGIGNPCVSCNYWHTGCPDPTCIIYAKYKNMVMNIGDALRNMSAPTADTRVMPIDIVPEK